MQKNSLYRIIFGFTLIAFLSMALSKGVKPSVDIKSSKTEQKQSETSFVATQSAPSNVSLIGFQSDFELNFASHFDFNCFNKAHSNFGKLTIDYSIRYFEELFHSCINSKAP